VNVAIWVLKRLWFPKNEDEEIARDSFFENITYLFPDSAKQAPLLGFSEIRKILNQNSETIKTYGHNVTIIYDRKPSKEETRRDYLENLEPKFTTAKFISKVDLIKGKSRLSAFERFSLLSVGLLLSLMIVLTAKRRVSYAVLIKSLYEFSILKRIFKDVAKVEFHDFVQYDIDSNLLYLFLKHLKGKDIVYFKYPSPGPLSLHNKWLLTDVLAINHGYHNEEIDHLKATIKYQRIEKVPPEGFFTYANLYEGELHIKHSTRIGFYSHAAWIRKMEGHASDGLNIAQSEEVLLTKLGQYLEQNPNEIITLFLHPKEKTDTYFLKAKTFYHRFLGDRFVISETPSTTAFDSVKLGVGVYSTILFERLICGFSTCIYTPSNTFPLQHSALNTVIINRGDFINQIERFLELSDRDFFKRYNLEYMVNPRFLPLN